jgi:uncharacterized protein (DUF488 family)
MNEILTIGHSTHSAEAFIALLKGAGATAVADVRSSPSSRFNPRFNKDTLKASLRAAGIHYLFLGKELGARSDDPSHYVGGRVSYERVAQSDPFKAGIGRVLKGAREQRIALMCAEKDPLTCHRTILVARALEKAGARVSHIGPDGSLESHEEALARLMRELRINAHDLFASPDELRAQAYRAQEARIAYERPEEFKAAE